MAIECSDESQVRSYRIFRGVRLSLALVTALQMAASSNWALAQTYTWTSTSNGNWSAAANWDILPVGGDATTLQFNAAGSQAYTATNDLADPFFLNRIILNSTSSGRPTITGAKLRFVAGGAKIRQDGTGAFEIAAPLKFDVPLTLEGSGSGYVTFTGGLSGMGGIIKGGSSTFVFGTAGSNSPAMNTFAGGLTIDGGTIRFADAQYSGPTAFRSNRVRFTSGTGSLIFDNSDANLGIELRIGELSGSAGSLLQARTSGNSSERGLNVLITTLGDAEYSGTFTNTAVSLTSDGILRIRGIGNQTISGPFNINSDIEVYSGATLTLTNSASFGTATGGRIYLNGGKLVFDARAMTGSNLIRDGSTSAGGIDGGGGGTFRFIGKTTGSSESLGRLELTDSSVNRAGAMHIELVHTATSAATVLTFASLDRQLPNAPRSTIDFAAFDANGNTLNLGQTGSNPRIVFSSGIFLTNSLLSRTTSAAASMSGYATVNGTDFATHNATNGISAVSTTAWTGSASSSTNFRLTADGNTGGASSTFGVSSLKIDSSGGALTLDISGTGNFQTNGIILAGSNNAAITSTGGGAWIGVGVRYAHVRQAVLTIGASIADTNPLVKAGGGTLVLTNGANSASNAVLAINEGVVRGSTASLPGGAIELRGGVLEITGGGTFNRTIGTATNNINWSGATLFDRGSGGFAAFGAPVVVDLNQAGASEIWWNSPNFILEGYTLLFGSTTADARITLLDSLGLSEQNAPAVQAYNAREIRIIDNPNSAADFARFSGVVSGDFTEDFLKTGAGILELSAANTYLGGTIVADGTLLLAHDLALGDPSAAYVLLGARSGTADITLATSLTTGSMTIARDLLVQSGSSGTATIGNAIAPDAATTANVLFSGDILVGLQGDTLAKGLKFNAVSGTTVSFSGSLTTHAGYGGVVSVEKIGGGVVSFSGSASYTGATTISSGRFIIAAGGSLAGGGGITVAAGATLQIAAGGQVTGSGSINVSGSAPIDDVAVNKGTVIVHGTAGTSNASIVVGEGGLLQGNDGTVNGSVTVERGGGIGPGGDVGKLTVTGPAGSTFKAGSHLFFKFNNASGATPGDDWDLMDFGSSRLSIEGIPSDRIFLHIDSWTADNLGHGANDFDTNATYHWLFATTGGVDPVSAGGTFSDRFAIVDDAPNAGVFGTGNPETRFEGSFYVTLEGNDLYLNYAAVPEPGSLTLVVVASTAFAWQRRRTKITTSRQAATEPQSA